MRANSYTTVSVDVDGTAAVHVELKPDEQVTLICPRGRDGAQLSIWHARAHVTISPVDSTSPTAGDVQVAHRLAEVFARYAAEVERLHVQNSVPDSAASAGAVA